MNCESCSLPLTADEIAVTKKLVNRGATSFYCVDCLAAYFAVTPDDIRERIAYFKASGCTLFSTGDGFVWKHPPPLLKTGSTNKP